MTSMKRTLVIMAKAPRPGTVKTRLASSLPIHSVTELYGCLLNDTITLAQSLHHVEIAVMCPAADVEELARAVEKPVRIVPQTGSGLAAGLDSVFTHFAAEGRTGVIAFNSDSPHLPASALQAAFDVLETRDLVIGPTQDGGYYLVGARAFHPGLFSNDGMGTGSALEALLARAASLQLSTGMVDPFYDVDLVSDLSQLADELQLAPQRAPRTAAWLAEWKRALNDRGSSAGASL